MTHERVCIQAKANFHQIDPAHLRRIVRVVRRIKIPVAAKTELGKIVKQIVNFYKPQKIILFGSYAHGHVHADSDLDLLIIKKTSKRFLDRLANVRRIVSDPQRSIPFAPIVVTPAEIEKRLAIGDQFIEEIINRGRILYAA